MINHDLFSVTNLKGMNHHWSTVKCQRTQQNIRYICVFRTTVAFALVQFLIHDPTQKGEQDLLNSVLFIQQESQSISLPKRVISSDGGKSELRGGRCSLICSTVSLTSWHVNGADSWRRQGDVHSHTVIHCKQFAFHASGSCDKIFAVVFRYCQCVCVMSLEKTGCQSLSEATMSSHCVTVCCVLLVSMKSHQCLRLRSTVLSHDVGHY